MDLINVLACDPSLKPVIMFVKNGLIPILQIGIPIILIILGMLDLGKAVMAGKEDEIKKNQTMLMKRAIAAIAVFFIVTIVTIVMGLFANTGDANLTTDSNKWAACWKEDFGDAPAVQQDGTDDDGNYDAAG